MPARKRARVARAASSPSVEPSTERSTRTSTPATQGHGHGGLAGRDGDGDGDGDVSMMDPDGDGPLQQQLWTDEQDIALFKGVVRWKPVGMHKHFRMIALAQHLRNQGYRDPHTAVPGIWKRLAAEYNLQTLDEREDSFGVETESEQEPYWPFRLPGQEFDELMFDRRLDRQRSSSPPQITDDEDEHTSTAADSEDLRSSPASSTRPTRGGRRGRGGRANRVRSHLRESITSVQSEAQESNDDDEDEEQQEEEQEEEDEDEDEEESERPAKGTSSGRAGRGSVRGGGRASRGRTSLAARKTGRKKT